MIILRFRPELKGKVRTQRTQRTQRMTEKVLNISALVFHVSKYTSYCDFNVHFASVSKTQHAMMKEKIFLKKKIKIQKMIVKSYEYYTRTIKCDLNDEVHNKLKLHSFDVRTIGSYNIAVKKLKEYEYLCN